MHVAYISAIILDQGERAFNDTRRLLATAASQAYMRTQAVEDGLNVFQEEAGERMGRRPSGKSFSSSSDKSNRYSN
jgi:hypothetical protein